MMDFSKVVKQQMAKRKVTIADIARATGYSFQYISDLISSHRRWNETTITKVSKFLEIEISFNDRSKQSA